MNKLRTKLLTILSLMTIFTPTIIKAYSDYIVASGKNIGIELNSEGIIIVGTYNIKNINPAKEANLQNGDKIISINSNKVSNINEMVEQINISDNKEEIQIQYQRGSKILNTTLKLEKAENDIYKTGLYVKDSINGVGTLTYIDPNTKIYGALGHEIIEKTTGQKLEIKSGKIYESNVTSITPSHNGNPGEKNVNYNTSNEYGNVKENTPYGIFGEYKEEINNEKLYHVAKYEEIKLGDAQILTVINENNIEKYNINIIKVNNNDSNKNILFEVTDEKLLNNTGGIIQGMSGSPIIQGDNIIGAVTYVVVDTPEKGYAINITKMLEEAEN